MSHREPSPDSGHYEDREPYEDRELYVEDRRSAAAAEPRRRIGGMKPGSAFFGWLAAMGMSVLLTALASAAGAGLGVSTDPARLVGHGLTVGIVGAVVIAVILFVSYYCGGYVAGRMARFDGARQGFAVWLWSVVIAIVTAAVVFVAGSRYNVFASLSFPRIPVDEGTLTTGGIIALVVAALVALIGALLGGVAGMRYHRRIDRATAAGPSFA